MADEAAGLVVKLAMENGSFQEGINAMNREMKVLQSEFKAAVAGNKNFENSLDGLGSKSEYLNKAIQTQGNIVEAYKKRLDGTKDVMANLVSSNQELQTKVEEAKLAYENSVETLGKEADATKTLEKELKNLESQYTKNETSIRQTSARIDNQTIAYNNAVAGLNRFEGELKDTQAAMEAMKNSAQQADDKLNNMGSNSSSFGSFKDNIIGAAKETKVFGVSLGDVGTLMSGGAGAAAVLGGAVAGLTTKFVELVAAGIQKTVQALADFTKSIFTTGDAFSAQVSRVQAISGMTGAQGKELRDLAVELGAASVYSSTEAAKALEYAALAGWKLNDMASGMPGILNLAAASGEELATVSDIVTDSLTALGYGTEQAGRMADVFSATMSNSNTNVSQIGEAMTYAGSVAGALGYSIEDCSLAIGLMANSSVKASTAGTALRRMFTQMPGGLHLASESMGEVTIATENADGTMRELGDVIVDLRKAFSNMTDAEKAMNAESISGKEGMSGLLAVVNAGEKDFNKLSEAIYNSAGVANNMSSTMIDNVDGLKEMISGKFESIKLSIYSIFEPIEKSFLKIYDAFLGVSEKIWNHLGKILSSITGLIEPFANMFVSAFSVISDTVFTVLEPVFYLVEKLLGSSLENLQGMANGIVKIFQGLGNVISSVLTPIINVVEAGIDLLTGDFEGAADKIKSIFNQSNSNIEKDGVTHNEAMSAIARAGESDINSAIEAGCEENRGIFSDMYSEIQDLTDEHYNSLKLKADAYNNNLSALDEAYEEYKNEKLSEYEKKITERYKNETLEQKKQNAIRMQQYEERLNQEIARNKAAEESKYANLLKAEEKAATARIKLNKEAEEKITKATQEEAKKRLSLWEKLSNTMKNVFSSSSSSNIGSIPAYASGTKFHPGGLALVGEKGPELINLSRGASVINNTQTTHLLNNGATEALLSTLVGEVANLNKVIKQQSFEDTRIIQMG